MRNTYVHKYKSTYMMCTGIKINVVARLFCKGAVKKLQKLLLFLVCHPFIFVLLIISRYIRS